MAEMSTSDQEFDFFFQLNTFICPMFVISMEFAILGYVSFGWDGHLKNFSCCT